MRLPSKQQAGRHGMTRLRWLVALAMVGVFLGLAPFAAALEIHHELAAADGDGHQHSDFDLCQWVQEHTGSSLLVVAPDPASRTAAGWYQHADPAELISARSVSTTSSRAPPVL